jgi:asparagine N-glycosylation enzyme membrane subunit Stt3
VGPAPPAPQGAHWLSVPHVITFALLWLAVHLLATLVWHPGVFHGAQLDPDGYMRLVRVDQLMRSGGWYNDMIARSNWPFGESHHWTRPLDVVILVVMMPLRAFIDGARALATAGAIVSPLAHLALCAAAVWVVFPLVRGPERFLAMPAVLAQPLVFAYGKLGRADHHILIFLLFTIALGAWIRALLEPSRRGYAVAAGAVTGLGIWVGPEMMLPLALLFLGGALAWILRGPRLAAINFRLAAGLAVAIAAAIMIERHPSEWLAVEFDKVSIAHLHVSLLALLFWWLAARYGNRQTPQDSHDRWRVRAALAAVGATVAGGLTLLAHPRFFRGPWVDVDPAVIDVWLQHVSELQPLFPGPGRDAGGFVAALGAGFVALAALVIWLRRETDPGRRTVWLLLLASLLVDLPLASAQLRFAPYVGIVAAIAVIELLRRGLDRVERRFSGTRLVLIRVALILALLLGPAIVGRAIPARAASADDAATDTAAACDLAALSVVLNDREGLGSRPRTIAAFIDFGPELLYRTSHRVLAGPYHRNRDGILATHQLLTTGDAQLTRSVIRERDIDLVLLCPTADQDYFGVGADGSLYQRLVRGDVPEGMRPIGLPTALASFSLFEVMEAR